MEGVEGPPIKKGPLDKRDYKLITLRNGLVVLLIHDPDVSSAMEESDSDSGSGSEVSASSESSSSSEDTRRQWIPGARSDQKRPTTRSIRRSHEQGPRFSLYGPKLKTTKCTGIGGVSFTSETKSRLSFHPEWNSTDEEGVPSRASHHDRLKQNKFMNRSKVERLKQDKRGGEEPLEESVNKNAAAAMCVGVGSMVDPENAQGLAHFLEHMLFMGSTRFPNENEYDKYLSSHGGSSNAYTEQEYTCFHFEVRNQYLRGSLERFSQFFISPLVKAEAMEREIKAIESEFVIAAGNDMNRLSGVVCHTAVPSHVYHHRFTWGNRKSLQSVPAEHSLDMRAQLLEVFHNHYQAGRMKLVVCGGGPLETLQKWAVELFSDIKPGGHGRWTQENLHADRHIWEPRQIYQIAANEDRSFMTISFPLPCMESFYLSKPDDYCGHLVGFEGEGSLLQLLKYKGLGRAVVAGCGEGGLESNSMVYVFCISITLTNEGVKQWLNVIGYVFEYLKFLRSVGPTQWIFDEQKTIGNLDFEYSSDSSINPDDLVSHLARNMFLYPEEHVIYGDSAWDVWQPELVKSVLSALTPDNMRVDVTAQNFDRTAAGNQPDVQLEPWFETLYRVATFPPDLIALWADPPVVDPNFSMPGPNEFIPTDFTVHSSNDPVKSKNPSCIVDSAAMRVWHRCNGRFKEPRVVCFFSIMFLPGPNQLDDAVLAQTYLESLHAQLNTSLYLAGQANLETLIKLSSSKIELKIVGFSEKLPMLAEIIAKKMGTLTVTEEGFKIGKEVVLEDYKRAHEKPSDHAEYLTTEILSKRFWNVDQRYARLRNLTWQDFNTFLARFFDESYIECLIDGNAQKKQAQAIAKIFKEAIVKHPLPPHKWPINRVVKIPPGINFLYKVNCRSSYERNSVVELYYQIGTDRSLNSIKLQCLIALLVDIIEEPFFDQLRTKEQLGYDLSCECHAINGVLGVSFMVQSAKYSPHYLETRMLTFVKQIPQMLRKMESKEFESHKESQISELLGLPSSLLEGSEIHWDEIWKHRYSFDQRKREAACLRKVTKLELLTWFRRYFGHRSRERRQLCVYVVGLNAQEGDVDDPVPTQNPLKGKVVIENLEEFKKDLPVFPSYP